VYRAIKLARKMGYEHPCGIAAASDPIMQVHYVVREVAALLKEKLKWKYLKKCYCGQQ